MNTWLQGLPVCAIAHRGAEEALLSVPACCTRRSGASPFCGGFWVGSRVYSATAFLLSIRKNQSVGCGAAAEKQQQPNSSPLLRPSPRRALRSALAALAAFERAAQLLSLDPRSLPALYPLPPAMESPRPVQLQLAPAPAGPEPSSPGALLPLALAQQRSVWRKRRPSHDWDEVQHADKRARVRLQSLTDEGAPEALLQFTNAAPGPVRCGMGCAAATAARPARRLPRQRSGMPTALARPPSPAGSCG